MSRHCMSEKPLNVILRERCDGGKLSICSFILILRKRNREAEFVYCAQGRPAIGLSSWSMKWYVRHLGFI